jgi:FKBP-type peptidyl-prolyl cis-trans isomerase
VVRELIYCADMSTKGIIIGIVIVLIIIVGAFLLINKTSQPATATAGQPGDAGAADTQVQAQEVSVGTGAQAAPGSQVSVLYVGKLPDGTVFDSSQAHGNQPLSFTLGAPGLIAGFQIGVNGMKEGGERLIAVPPSLGYGSQDVKDASGKVVIPANSTLVFDIKLVKVSAAAASSTPAKQ